MGFMDKFRNGKKATLPGGAKVVRRRRNYGSRQTDTGYWYNNQFFLIDGTLCDSYDYEGGQGEVLNTGEARAELSDAGYDADSYTAPATTSYDSTPVQSYDPGPAYTPPSYDPGPSTYSPPSTPSYDSGSHSSPSPSYDSSPSPSSTDTSSW